LRKYLKNLTGQQNRQTGHHFNFEVRQQEFQQPVQQPQQQRQEQQHQHQQQYKLNGLKPPNFSMLYNSTPSLSLSKHVLQDPGSGSRPQMTSSSNGLTRRQLGLPKPAFSSRLPTQK